MKYRFAMERIDDDGRTDAYATKIVDDDDPAVLAWTMNEILTLVYNECAVNLLANLIMDNPEFGSNNDMYVAARHWLQTIKPSPAAGRD